MEKKEYIKPEIAVLQMETQAILVVSNTIPKATQGDYSDDNVSNFIEDGSIYID